MKKFKRVEHPETWTEKDLGWFPELKNALMWGARALTSECLKKIAIEDDEITVIKRICESRDLPFKMSTVMCHPTYGVNHARNPIIFKKTRAEIQQPESFRTLVRDIEITQPGAEYRSELHLINEPPSEAGVIVWGCLFGGVKMKFVKSFYLRGQKTILLHETRNECLHNRIESRESSHMPHFTLPLKRPQDECAENTKDVIARIKQLWGNSDPMKCEALKLRSMTSDSLTNAIKRARENIAAKHALMPRKGSLSLPSDEGVLV